MSVYYRGSGLTWKQYLQADSFVQDITGQVKRSGEGIKMAISVFVQMILPACADR